MDNLTLIQEKWPDILRTLREETDLTAVSYTTWIEPLEVIRADQEGVTLFVPMGGMAIPLYNKKNYTLSLRTAISEVTGLNLRIHYTDNKDMPEAAVTGEEMDEELENRLKLANVDPQYTFDSFVVGSNNKYAHAAALAVAEAPGEIYNPLYLYSGVGLGKTHLMCSIAHYILENNPSSRVIYVTSEVFTNELIDSIRSGNSTAMSKFRAKYRNVDVLIIDDIQFIMGKEATQEEFFHTFESLYAQKKQIIVSSDKPPKDLDILEERISSRLQMGVIADISLPDYETRMAILRKKMEEKNYQIPNDILDYIATNVKQNIRQLEGCINMIVSRSRLEMREIDFELARSVVEALVNPEIERKITSEDIMRITADHFGITVQEISSQRRDRKYVFPRMIAMYVSREMTEESLTTIGYTFGGRDHSTVLNAVNKVERDCPTDPQTRNAVEAIKKKLSPG